MDGDSSDAVATTPRKSLLRSASWAPRSSPTAEGPGKPDASEPSRAARRPTRLALPARPPAAGWPKPALDDSGGALCSADLSRVVGHVYLGSDAAARDRAGLRRHGVTHVLNCVGAACPNHFLGDPALRYATLWLHDSPAEDLASVLYDAFDFLEGAAAVGGRALVHCVRGTSRSAAVVVAYLMWRHRLPFDVALRHVRAARPAADPNLGFAAQLLRRQPRAPGPGSPGAPAVRTLRLAPHSPYAPLHIVPKAVLATGAGFLDSRGAFLVHTIDAVYVWLGVACEPAMAVAAGRVSRQLVKYERVVGPIVTVHEGTEPCSFWDAVGIKDGAVGDASEASRRRVEAYDLDYEIFHYAIKSTVVEESQESLTPSSSSSTGSTLSPLSSPSPSPDFYHSPCTLDSFEGCQTPSTKLDLGMPPLQTSRVREPIPSFPLSGEPSVSGTTCVSETTTMQSLAERRQGVAPSLVLLQQSDEERDWIRDWCLSPAFIPDVDEEAVNLDRCLLLGPSEELEAEEDDNKCSSNDDTLLHPSLFRWPDMDEMEIHSTVLDSGSVFLMLAPKPRTGARKVLYVWFGRNSELNKGVDEKDRDTRGENIGMDFVMQMELPKDIPIQIITEGQEPEQFLNHLFSFH